MPIPSIRGCLNNTNVKARIDHELRERAPAAAGGGIILLLGLSYLTKIPIFSGSWVVLASAVLILFPNLIRFYAARKSRYSWRTLSSVSVLLSGMGWAGLSSWILLTYHFDRFESQVTLLFLSGIASSSLLTLAADPKVFRCFVGLTLLVPISIYSLSHPDGIALPYLMIFLMYCAFLYKQSSIYFTSLIQKFKNEMKLEEERALLSTILDTVPGFLSYIDKDLRYVAMNANLRNALGLRENEYVGKPVGFLDENDEWTLRLKDFSKSRRLVSNQELLLKIGEEKRWHLVSMRKTEGLDWIVLVSIDIHQEKELALQAEDQRARSEIAAKMAALGEMSAGVAHEINNPLAIIKGKAQTLQRYAKKTGPHQEILEKHSESISGMVDRIAKIVKGLRSFARDGSQDPFICTSVSAIIEETLCLCQSRFKNNGIEIKVDLNEKPLFIDCRSTEVSQVLLNLLNNSFDAIEGLPEKWVKISVQDFSNQVEVRITDSGNGIPVELHQKIIQPFFTTKEVGKGTGLGLSISQGIVKSHQGTLEIDPYDKNTSFVIRFPKTKQIQSLVA